MSFSSRSCPLIYTSTILIKFFRFWTPLLKHISLRFSSQTTISPQNHSSLTPFRVSLPISLSSQTPRISQSPLHRLHSGPVYASECEGIELKHCSSTAPSGIIITLHFDSRLICNVCVSIKVLLIFQGLIVDCFVIRSTVTRPKTHYLKNCSRIAIPPILNPDSRS